MSMQAAPSLHEKPSMSWRRSENSRLWRIHCPDPEMSRLMRSAKLLCLGLGFMKVRVFWPQRISLGTAGSILTARGWEVDSHAETAIKQRQESSGALRSKDERQEWQSPA